MSESKSTLTFSAYACCPCGSGLARVNETDAWACATLFVAPNLPRGDHLADIHGVVPEIGKFTTRRTGE